MILVMTALAGTAALLRTTRRFVAVAAVTSLVAGLMVRSMSDSTRPCEAALVTGMVRPVALGSLQL